MVLTIFVYTFIYIVTMEFQKNSFSYITFDLTIRDQFPVIPPLQEQSQCFPLTTIFFISQMKAHEAWVELLPEHYSVNIYLKILGFTLFRNPHYSKFVLVFHLFTQCLNVGKKQNKRRCIIVLSREDQGIVDGRNHRHTLPLLFC